MQAIPDGILDEYQDAELLWDLEEPECHGMLDSTDEDIPVRVEPILVNKTPLKDDVSRASSPQLHTPQLKELILPFPTCNESPIDRCVIAASTPFQGQRISSTSSDIIKPMQRCNRGAGNATFTLDKQMTSHVDTTFSINEGRQTEGTFIKEGKNLTFTTEDKNMTFDVKLAEKDSGSDVMESCTHLESSAESTEDKNVQRKLLSAIPQARIANANKDPNKKVSRLGAPRMNAAAISRIQAKSPQTKHALSASSNSSASIRCLKKPSSTASAGKARKSLLPPNVNASKKPLQGVQARTSESAQEQKGKNVKHGPSGAPTKRKAPESPKREALKIGTHTTIPSRVSALPGRSNSAPVSKLPNTARSRIQRPSALKGPSSYSRLSNNGNKSTGTSGSLLASAKHTSKSAPDIHSSHKAHGSFTSAEPQLKHRSHHEKCVTALATLLDYVVNQVDGLSAPRLSREKCQLQKLVDDKDEINSDLSTQLSELEARLAVANQRYERKLNDEKTAKDELQDKITNLLAELESERKGRREAIASRDLEIEELGNRHSAELEEWSEKYQSLERNMQSRIEEELKERMKPYVSSVSEVKSLTAVLEMRNEKIHQLQVQCAGYSSHRDEIQVLSHKYEQLKQKNEDLAMQLQDRADETRNLSDECQKLQRSFSEEQSRSTRLLHHNEELQYRLDSLSPLSPSFNPVFTTSPIAGEEEPFDATRRTTGSKRTSDRASGISVDKWPKSLSYQDEQESRREIDNAL